MSRQTALQMASAPAEQPHRRAHRCYTVAQLLKPDLLNMPRSTFFRLRGLGELPFLKEIEPRAGRLIRYRADLVDRWLDGQWGSGRRFFASHGGHRVSERPLASMTQSGRGAQKCTV